jgi:hypothetical protein
MNLHTLGFLSSVLFIASSVSWFIYFELERRHEKRRQERIRQGRELTRKMHKLMRPF